MELLNIHANLASMVINLCALTREGFIAATTAVSIRTGMSYRYQTQILSAIVNYLDDDVQEMCISRSSVQKERYKQVEMKG